MGLDPFPVPGHVDVGTEVRGTAVRYLMTHEELTRLAVKLSWDKEKCDVAGLEAKTTGDTPLALPSPIGKRVPRVREVDERRDLPKRVGGIDSVPDALFDLSAYGLSRDSTGLDVPNSRPTASEQELLREPDAVGTTVLHQPFEQV